MKIGIFLPNATFDLPGAPEVGGIETFSFTVGEALQRLGHEVVLFGGRPKQGRRHRPTSLTLELHPYWETRSIPKLGTRFRRLVQRLHFGWRTRHAWSRHRCDLLLIAKPFDWPVAWWWKRQRPELKVIMGFHGTDFFPFDARFYGAVNAAFAVSPRVADLAEQRVGRRPALIPVPVDADFFSPGERGTPGPHREAWQIVSAGRLVGWKGFAHLIEACAQLQREHSIPVRLDLAGDGSERSALTAQIARLGLTNEITLHGALDPLALRALLRAGDLYVQPSIGLEAFGTAPLEAASVGLPLALSDQVGLARFLGPEDFTSYPAHDIGALTELLRRLYARRHDSPWIDRAARHHRMRGQFAAENVARQILVLATA